MNRMIFYSKDYFKEIQESNIFMESGRESGYGVFTLKDNSIKKLSNFLEDVLLNSNTITVNSKKIRTVIEKKVFKDFSEKVFRDILELTRFNLEINLDGYINFYLNEYKNKINNFLYAIIKECIILT